MSFHSPSLTSASVLSAFVLVVFVFRAVCTRWLQQDRRPYPPGPSAVPLLGNVHQLPVDYQQRKFAEWGRKYGEVVFARFFRTPALILNSREAAAELLEKRSRNYSSRPRFILLAELMGWDSVLNNIPYGERFRKHRKWLHDAFGPKEVLAAYVPIQRRETYTLLANLCETPEHFMEHLTRWAAATIMEITYGHRVKSNDDPFIALAEEAAVETVKAGSPGSMLVDFFPILKGLPLWAPGSGFKHRAFYVRELIRRTLDTPFDMVKRALRAGTAAPSFTATLLDEAAAEGSLTTEHEEDIKGAAGVIYTAGTETTVTAMKTFILAMVLHPDVCQKAQAEIDRVIGPDRLPDIEDQDSLPYLRCVLREVLRWNAPVPLGVPHAVQADDVYRGYHIPNGAMVIPNIWWMTQDPDVYPEPEKFNPERYLDQGEKSDPRDVVFGFGRRICPGQAFAEASLWLAAANILATMDLGYAQDHLGRDIVPDAAFISGFVSHPKAFTCSIRPRSARIQDLVTHMNAVNIVTA
ncbi:cytochrome P450 [Trametes meyenii]|nr:cytochrome P450 [Trametes meyenii]